jgi:hypothetical protein
MPDNFYFSGLMDGWFAEYFEQYHLFGYIGDREKLDKYQKTKPFWRRAAEIVIPSISLTSILTKLAGFDLGIRKTESKVAKQIIDLINEEENQRLVSDFLQIAQKRCDKERHFFDGVGKRYNKKNAVMSAGQRGIDNRLIVVEGQLINRSTVAQFAPNSDQQLQASREEWLLGDFPPHGMVERNTDFKGDILRLKEDDGFSDAFADYVPFCRTIGWYPYCRITGFYDSSRIATEVFPQLSIAFVEYRRPKLYQAVGAAIVNLLDRETRRPIYLDDWSDRLAAAYLLPLVTWASNMKEFRASEDQRETLKSFAKFVGDDMPSKLVPWYQYAITA